MAKSVTLKNSNGDTLYPVTDASLINGSLQASQIPANAITTDRISDGAVTTAKIASQAVTTSKIANLAVTANRVADGELTQDKFNLDKFPAGHLGYYFTSNKTTTNSSTGVDLGNAVTITSTIPVRVMFEFSSVMKTSRYTSNVALKVDGTVVASSGTNSTSFTTIIGRHIMTLSGGSHSVVVAIRSQDSGTTATADSYTSETNGLAWWCV